MKDAYFSCWETITNIRTPTKHKAAKISKAATGNLDAEEKKHKHTFLNVGQQQNHSGKKTSVGGNIQCIHPNKVKGCLALT